MGTAGATRQALQVMAERKEGEVELAATEVVVVPLVMEAVLDMVVLLTVEAASVLTCK